MSHQEDDSSEAFIGVARAVRTRGLKGEIVAELLTDFPDRFELVDQLTAIAPGGERKVVELEDFWFQNERVVLKFAGYDDVEKASELVGYEFAVPESARVPLPEGHFYDWELEGCIVKVVDGPAIGSVRAVLKTGATEILEVEDHQGVKRLIPLASSIVLEIDIPGKTIVVDPPEGLLDL